MIGSEFKCQGQKARDIFCVLIETLFRVHYVHGLLELPHLGEVTTTTTREEVDIQRNVQTCHLL